MADDGDWAGLLPVLHTLLNISSGFAVVSYQHPIEADLTQYSLSIETLEYAICLVARLTLDSTATTDCVVLAAVEEVLTTLVCSIPEANQEASVSMT